MTDLLISVSSLGHLKYIENKSLSQIIYIYIYIYRERERERERENHLWELEKNSDYTLRYLQNILPYIIIECKMHYASLKKLLNLRHCQITIIDSLI